jgi:nitrogen-specific signal transduction histidine kinase
VGKPVRRTGVGVETTKQRLVEEQLRQSQKMEAVGQLTGGIAHDFNNLLQGITGSLEIIQKRVAQGRFAGLDRFVSGATTAANRAAALTHRLLAFSRRQPLDPRPVNVNALLKSMEDLVRRTIGESVDLVLDLAEGLSRTRCDPNQLENAVLNLVINARDAMPHGGRLTVETANRQRDAQEASGPGGASGEYICVSVTDTGTGMSADTIAKAFEPFFTTKPIGQGTGLGLSMIYGFAQQSKGHTQVHSEIGKGTRFELYLPRYRGEDGDEECDLSVLPSDIPASESGEAVLVVEDDDVVRSLIIEELHELGYATLEAIDGPGGFEILQSARRVDLLVTDIGLPGINGRQVADAGRVLRPGLKVLFMTGYAENAALASGFLEPGMEMITKPFAMGALATKVRQMLEV